MKKSEIDLSTKSRVLADYLDKSLKVHEIAKKHDVSIPTLTAMVLGAGIPRRPRGPRRLTQPSARTEQILAYAAAHGFSKAARHFNITRQLVSSTAKRWGVQPQKPVRVQQDEHAEMEPRARKGKKNREIIVCFRLKMDELRLLRDALPLSVSQSAGSVHKLARAAILERIEKRIVHEDR